MNQEIEEIIIKENGIRKNYRNIKVKKERLAKIKKALNNSSKYSDADLQELEKAKEILENQIARLKQENRDLSKELHYESNLGPEEER